MKRKSLSIASSDDDLKRSNSDDVRIPLSKLGDQTFLYNASTLDSHDDNWVGLRLHSCQKSKISRQGSL